MSYNNRMTRDEKILFAIRDKYTFSRTPGLAAIRLGKTCLRMTNGPDIGIFCGPALPYLPGDFVIPMLVDRVTTEPATGRQAQYQMAKAGKYYWLRMEPAGTGSYGNFANCALTNYTKRAGTYETRLTRPTAQDMTVAHCSIVFNDNEGSTSRHVRSCEAYLLLNKTNKDDKRHVNYQRHLKTGYEVLVDQHYGGYHKV
jgi:hypothetical protein